MIGIAIPRFGKAPGVLILSVLFVISNEVGIAGSDFVEEGPS